MNTISQGGTAVSAGRQVSWVTTVTIVLMHIGAVAALFFFSWKAAIIAAALYWLAIGCGIGMGYHRLHTHRSYSVPKLVDYFLAICGTLTLQGGPIFWVATHRVHHQYSDKEGDPHSPRDGAFWSHMGWILFGESLHNDTARMARYAPDLARVPFYRWLNTLHYVPLTMVSLALLFFGGLDVFLWATCVRIVLGLHATWLVNSAAHLWGPKRFSTRDDSRNNWWVALLTFGEGWHNNHHAFPTSCRHGLAWYELDVTWIQIRLLQLLGLARSVKVANLETGDSPRVSTFFP